MYTTEPHINEKFKNQTLLWNSFDSEELFETNLATRPEKLKLHGWSSESRIEYQFNSYGFRANEFSDSDNLIALGCSHTLGTGITESSRWSTIVSKTLGLADYNLGIGGASADCCFRMALNWIPQLKPKVVLYQNPEPSRFEWFDTVYKKPHNMLASSQNHSAFYKEWVLCERNLTMNYFKNLYAIQYLAESVGALFVHISLDNIIRLDAARDLGHYGPKTNHTVAEDILLRLNWRKTEESNPIPFLRT